MSRVHVTLAGLPIDLHAGVVDQAYSQATGWSDVRLSGGSLVRMAHWSRETITLSGVGWMGLGFDAIDFTMPLELRCTMPKSITGSGLSYTLTSTPRPDVAPWALALVGNQWISTSVTISGLVATVTPVAAATAYRVSWMPIFTVFVSPPEEALDAAGSNYSWSFVAQEA